MRRRGCIWLGGGFALVATACALLLVGTSDMGGCSFWEGKCAYDPRVQRPNTLFIEHPPEAAIVRYIEEQAKLHSTFPPNAGFPITSIEPTWVSAWGFMTDWHVVANVKVAVRYSDQTSRTLHFEIMERLSSPLSFMEKTTMHASFGPPANCEPSPSGAWHCTNY